MVALRDPAPPDRADPAEREPYSEGGDDARAEDFKLPPGVVAAPVTGRDVIAGPEGDACSRVYVRRVTTVQEDGSHTTVVTYFVSKKARTEFLETDRTARHGGPALHRAASDGPLWVMGDGVMRIDKGAAYVACARVRVARM